MYGVNIVKPNTNRNARRTLELGEVDEQNQSQ